MAEIIPTLNRQTLGRMTKGEKRFARVLEHLLEDDYLVWYDIPVGRQRRYPDFIILHPQRGLLFLEVKDWKLQTLKKINKTEVVLLTGQGLVTKPNPLEQVRQGAYSALKLLEQDSLLQQKSKKYQGKLVMPYGWGVVLANITRKQMQKALSPDGCEQVLPDHLVIYKDEMTETADAERFQKQLWDMFNYSFGKQLTLPQIDRIRWHLFPEIRIDNHVQQDFFDNGSGEEAIPDIVKVMDIQQEQLARSLGEGHRVIHGVAGSGKTLILGYRCQYLAQAQAEGKPILVLCFNITLAARLRTFISEKGIGHRVQVYHFHDWCKLQLKTYHVDVLESDAELYNRQVETVIQAVENGRIPRAQYSAVLIDEGHDFEPEWLQLVVQMIDPETNSLLLLYDDAQSIYKRGGGLDFSLSSVGIQARGRTTILRMNYRNTREILQFAYDFAKDYLSSHTSDDDHIPLVEPEATGNSGPLPEVRRFGSFDEEAAYAVKCVNHWHRKGTALEDVAILCVAQKHLKKVAEQFHKAGIPCLAADTQQRKAEYDPACPRVTVMTIHSSKGLEFSRVIMLGIGILDDSEEENVQKNTRLLYVGMTRAREHLLLTTSEENAFSAQMHGVLEKLVA